MRDTTNIPCPLRNGKVGMLSLCDRPRCREKFMQQHISCTDGNHCLVSGNRNTNPEVVDETNQMYRGH